MAAPPSDNSQLQLLARTLDDIAKSPEDRRAYRGLELTNGVRALLVSRPPGVAGEKFYAIASVPVGSMCDPPDCQGLASLCQLCIMTASHEYPDAEAYASFLSSLSASFIARTKADLSSYYFLLRPGHVAEGLDRMAAALHRPLFPEAAIKKALATLSSNCRRDSTDTMRQLEQLQRCLSNPTHPYCRFAPGSKDTLLPSAASATSSDGIAALRQRLVEFHERHYSTSGICLVLTGDDSLDQLQAMVLASFGKLPPKSLAPPTPMAHPFDGTETGVKVWVNFSAGSALYYLPETARPLTLQFPLPEQWPLHPSCPDLYICGLLSCEGRGGLCDCLKRWGLAHRVTAELDCQLAGPGFDTLCVVLVLTEKGAEDVDRVLAAVFRYLALLRQAPPQEWLHSQGCLLRAMQRCLSGHPAPTEQNLAERIHRCPMRDVVTARHELVEFSPGKIADLLAYLRADRCKAFVQLSNIEYKCDRTEARYGTPYGIEQLSPSLLSASTDEFSASPTWSELDAELRLPEPNRFVGSSSELRPREPPTTEQPQGPRQLRVERPDVTRLWFRQDTEFLIPCAFYCVDLVAPASFADCASSVLTRLYGKLAEHSLRDLAAEAQQAGLQLKVSRSSSGFQVACHGGNQRLCSLLDEALRRMARPEDFDEEIFQRVRKKMRRDIGSTGMTRCNASCNFYLEFICGSCFFSSEDQIEAVDGATLQKVQQFARAHLLPQPSSQQHQQFAEILVYGDATAGDAVRVARTVLAALWPSSTATSSAAGMARRPREPLLPNGSHHLFRWSSSTKTLFSCLVYYQTEAPSDPAGRVRHHVVLELLLLALDNHCLLAHSHRDPLSYFHVSKRPGRGTVGIGFSVQSRKLHPVEDEKKIDALVDSIDAGLESISAQDYQALCDKLLAKLRAGAKAPSMRHQRDAHWGEIARGGYWFCSKAQMADCLESTGVTCADLVAFWQTWLSKASPSRRKLSLHSVHLEAFGPIESDPAYAKYPGTIIADPMAFKLGLAQTPLATAESLGPVFEPPSAATT